jgi:two-component system chemotaxis response regulator CheY
MQECLIVDDSRVIRKIARQIFEALGFSCREAEDGAQAVAACQQQMPYIILLDWNMPVMNGIEFLRELRKMPNGGQPQVVFCTTETDLKHIQEALSSGANEYIMKPFDAEIVQSKLSQLGLLNG